MPVVRLDRRAEFGPLLLARNAGGRDGSRRHGLVRPPGQRGRREVRVVTVALPGERLRLPVRVVEPEERLRPEPLRGSGRAAPGLFVTQPARSAIRGAQQACLNADSDDVVSAGHTSRGEMAVLGGRTCENLQDFREVVGVQVPFLALVGTLLAWVQNMAGGLAREVKRFTSGRVFAGSFGFFRAIHARPERQRKPVCRPRLRALVGLFVVARRRSSNLPPPLPVHQAYWLLPASIDQRGARVRGGFAL